jgi:hypothetical protein
MGGAGAEAKAAMRVPKPRVMVCWAAVRVNMVYVSLVLSLVVAARRRPYESYSAPGGRCSPRQSATLPAKVTRKVARASGYVEKYGAVLHRTSIPALTAAPPAGAILTLLFVTPARELDGASLSRRAPATAR